MKNEIIESVDKKPLEADKPEKMKQEPEVEWIPNVGVTDKPEEGNDKTKKDYQ